jgi:hypothetical protein
VGSISLERPCIFLLDTSGRCIFEAPSFQVLFCFQFNGALTEGNYLQLFFGGTADFFALGCRVLGRGSEEARRLVFEGVG